MSSTVDDLSSDSGSKIKSILGNTGILWLIIIGIAIGFIFFLKKMFK